MKRVIKSNSSIQKVNLHKVTDGLFEYLKDYGAVSVSRYIDEHAINFKLNPDEVDYDMLHYAILSQGYKEVARYGTDPVVTDYINEAGNVCVKLQEWSSGILRVKVSEEGQNYMNVESASDVTAGRQFYFGMEQSAEFGDLIQEKLGGKTVSKRKDLGDLPGGLVYEAKKLGIDMWDLLEALEGMCHEGRAQEIDDSTYKVLPKQGESINCSSNANQVPDESLLESLIYDAQNNIPYELAETAEAFEEAALEYIQNRLVSEYNYTETQVNQEDIVQLIEEAIANSEGDIW